MVKITLDSGRQFFISGSEEEVSNKLNENTKKYIPFDEVDMYSEAFISTRWFFADAIEYFNSVQKVKPLCNMFES